MLGSLVLAMAAGEVAVVAGGWVAVAAATAATVLSMVDGFVTWRDTRCLFRAVTVALLVVFTAAAPWAVDTQRWLQPGPMPCAGCIVQPGSIPSLSR